MTRRITAASGESTGLSGVENSVEIPAVGDHTSVLAVQQEMLTWYSRKLHRM